jgi:hypothetical protein
MPLISESYASSCPHLWTESQIIIDFVFAVD